MVTLDIQYTAGERFGGHAISATFLGQVPGLSGPDHKKAGRDTRPKSVDRFVKQGQQVRQWEVICP